MKKVGIWIRVSTDMQAQGDSPEVHERRGRMYAEVKDWKVVEVYHLESMSGKSVSNLSETRRMLADIKSGKIEALIFSKIARFARNTRELLEFAEMFEQDGADMISLGESIDTSTPSGRLFFTLIAALAQWEREEISERIAASIPIRAKMGKSIGGQAPFGYAWDNSELVINEDEAPIRKLVFELFLKHQRKRIVAKVLNEKGYRTRKGSEFNASFIRRILLDPVSKGVRRVNYLTTRKGHIEDKHEDDWVYVKVPAIIDEVTWNETQRIHKEQKAERKIPLKKSLNLFTGIAKCGCGGKMYVLSKTKKYTCNDCKRKITCTDLEEIFKDQLHSFSMSEHSVEEVLELTKKEENGNAQLLQGIEKDIQETEKSINALFQLHEQGQIPTEDFATRYQEPKNRLASLHDERERLGYVLQHQQAKTQDHLKVFESLQDVYGTWDTLGKQEKRNIIEVMAKSISIYEDEVEITLEQLNPYFSESVTFGGGTHRDCSYS